MSPTPSPPCALVSRANSPAPCHDAHAANASLSVALYDTVVLVARPEPELTAAEGPLGGPSYSYRGAVIDCQKGGHVCLLRMPEHPLHGHSFGVAGTITPLVDL